MLRIRCLPRSRRAISLLALGSLVLGPPSTALHAQDPARPDTGGAARSAITLSLDEAIRLAERHSPALRQVRNDEDATTWGLRAAWGRFLPSADVGGGMQYQDAASSARFGIFTGEDLGFDDVPPYYISDYSIGLGLALSRGMFAGLDAARARTRAASASTRAERAALRQTVVASYLAVLRAEDVVRLREAELERAEQTLALARARSAVGAAVPVEAQQARVARGRAEVAVLRAEAALEEASLRMLQTIGLAELPGDAESMRLTSTFHVFRPPWDEDVLVRDALARQPRLGAMRAQANAGEAALSEAKGRYWPSLNVSAGWSGYSRQVGSSAYLLAQAREAAEGQIANCETTNLITSRLVEPLPTFDCSQFELTPAMEEDIITRNDVFPFDFTPQPFSMRIGVSFPIFDGFSRQATVAQARAQAEDATEALRAERLRLTTDVRALLRRLRLEHRAARLEEENLDVAEAQLRLARERYRVGSVRLLDLTEAEALYVQAAQAHLDAIYRFHETLALLELAVGRPLRDEAPEPEPGEPPDSGGARSDPSGQSDPASPGSTPTPTQETSR